MSRSFEDWGNLGLQLNQRNNITSWWQSGHHDKELVKGVLAHGFWNWEAIFEDNKLKFRVFDSFSEAGNHLDPKDCMKHLRFIGIHLRRCLRKLKARHKRHSFMTRRTKSPQSLNVLSVLVLAFHELQIGGLFFPLL